jgi:hypothetical protein
MSSLCAMFSGDLRRTFQRDEAKVVFPGFGRIVVRVQIRVADLPFVGAVAVVFRLEVHGRHGDAIPSLRRMPDDLGSSWLAPRRTHDPFSDARLNGEAVAPL